MPDKYLYGNVFIDDEYLNYQDSDGWQEDDDKTVGNKEENKNDKEVKCECGAEKCNTTHVYWCPKYEKEKK
jgi:hypothetical protein